MSFIQPNSIQAIAHSLDVPRLSSEAAKALAPDVEYRLREIIQEAQKFARHSKRVKVTTEDIDNALRLRNFEPLYGFSNKDPAKYMRASGHPDVVFVQDRELTFEQIIDAPLPKTPLDVSVMPHWLFINGVQPKIPENSLIERPVTKRMKKSLPATGLGQQQHVQQKHQKAQQQQQQQASGQVQDGAEGGAREASAVLVQPPVQHVLSKELQLYFNKAIAVLKLPPLQEENPNASSSAPQANGAPTVPGPSYAPASSSSSASKEQSRLQDAVIASIASDPGLHPLVPYFTKFVADGVSEGLKSIPTLHIMLRLVRAMLSNKHMQLAPYIHQLLPPVLTCLVAKGIGTHPLENHWGVRDEAAKLVQLVCQQFGDPYFNVPPRISRTLLKALLDSSKPLSTHYGAVVGLAALGRKNVQLLLLPQLEPYMKRLRPLLDGKLSSAPSSRPSGSGAVDGASSLKQEDGGAGISGNGHAAMAEANGDAAAKDAQGGSASAAAKSGARIGAQGEGSEARGSGSGGSQVHAQREEALRVYGALLDAVSAAVYDRLLRLVAGSDFPIKSRRSPLFKDMGANGKQSSKKQSKKGCGKTSSQKDDSMDVDEPEQQAHPSSKKEAKQDTGLSNGDGGGSAEAAAGDVEMRGAEDAQPASAGVSLFTRSRSPASSSSTTRSVAEILAEAWQEDAPMKDIVWALSELFGEDFSARMPHGLLPFCTV